MSQNPFPKLIQELPAFAGPFDANQLIADGCKVLFASYPAGTKIEPHTHPTKNCGVITAGELILVSSGKESCYGPGDWNYLEAEQKHAARFEIETSEIEFWFDA